MTHADDHDNQERNESHCTDERDISRVDRLIEHLIDPSESCEAASAWDEFRIIAARDHHVWQRLAEAQQVHRSLSDALDCVLAPALSVDLPLSAATRPTNVYDGHLGWMRRHAGWAAAIAVAVLWGGSLLVPSKHVNTNGGSPSGMTAPNGPDRSAGPGGDPVISGRQASTMTGDLVGTTKPILLDMRQREDGTMEVVYGHWVIERSQVDHFYNRQWDETGRPVDTPQPATEAVPSNFW